MVNKLYIPSIGDTLEVAAPWTFSLQAERRNETFIKAFGIDKDLTTSGKPITHYYYYYGSLEYKGVTLKDQVIDQFVIPVGAQLSVSRIYIRQGQKEFNSITFNLLKNSCSGITDQVGVYYPIGRGRVRFWAPLHEVNGLVFR